jgi:hypothetical protein
MTHEFVHRQQKVPLVYTLCRSRAPAILRRSQIAPLSRQSNYCPVWRRKRAYFAIPLIKKRSRKNNIQMKPLTYLHRLGSALKAASHRSQCVAAGGRFVKPSTTPAGLTNPPPAAISRPSMAGLTPLPVSTRSATLAAA